MVIKLGDRVRFLNDVGGGVVVKLCGSSSVVVEQDDGFAIPCPLSECVVVEYVVKNGESTVATSTKIEESKLVKPPKKEDNLELTPSKIEKLRAALNGEYSPRSSLLPNSSASRSSKIVQNLIEVDLHIDNLLDSTKGMSSGAMLEYQLDYFRKIIIKHEQNRGQRLIFIHGKGDGVLRSSLERELRRLGLGGRYRAASFKRYGSGAIEVTL